LVTPQAGTIYEAVCDGEGGRRRCRSRNLARRGRPSGFWRSRTLEHAKTAVLNSLTSASGQRTYDHAIREFVTWYCSEPRLAFNRTVVLRYRFTSNNGGMHLPPSTFGSRRFGALRTRLPALAS
jgi:hypothetical protein